MSMCDKIGKLMFLCALLVIITGCGSQSVVKSSYYGEDYQQGTDFNYASYNWAYDAQPMIHTEQGYYLIAGSYLFFADTAGSDAVPLCFKTDCLHQEETDDMKVPYCDAFLGNFITDNPFLGYYKEHIYTVYLNRHTGNYYLVEMKMDGSDRREICSINLDKIEDMFMHRGVFYFVSSLKNLDGEMQYGLNAISFISGAEEPVQVYTGAYEDGWIQCVLAYGNHIFFQDCYAKEEGYANGVIMYDIKTGESETLLEGESIGIYGIEDDSLLVRIEGQYYVYSLKDRKVSPSRRNYEAFLKAHPQWQCHCENATDDMTFFSCYDLEAREKIGTGFRTDLYVLNSKGEVAAVLPDMGWSRNGSYLFEEGGEEYLFRYSSTQVSEFFINVYAKRDLLEGIVAPKTILWADSFQALTPQCGLKLGE